MSPVDASDLKLVSPAATSHATNSVVSSFDNAMVVTVFFATAAAAGVTGTPPTGETERYDLFNGNLQGLSSNDELQAASGATGVKTATSSQSVKSYAAILTLRPA